MRPKKVITILLVVVLLIFVSYSMRVSPIISDEKFTYLSGLTWYNTYADGNAAAREQDKPIFVYFWATWCKFCRNMQEEVYPDPEIYSILKEDFVLVAVDLDSNKEDAQAFGIQYPPAEIFITPDGQLIDKIGGGTTKDVFLFRLNQAKSYYNDLEREP